MSRIVHPKFYMMGCLGMTCFHLVSFLDLDLLTVEAMLTTRHSWSQEGRSHEVSPLPAIYATLTTSPQPTPPTNHSVHSVQTTQKEVYQYHHQPTKG
jgi:hypothetical protein